MCNHEQSLGGPNTAQFGAELGLTRFVCGAVFHKLLRLGCAGPAFPYPLAMVLQTSSGQQFSEKARNSPFQRQRRGVGSWAARDALQKARLGSHMGVGTPKCMYAHHSEASPGKDGEQMPWFFILPTRQVARNTIRNTMAFLKVIDNISNCILLECY